MMPDASTSPANGKAPRSPGAAELHRAVLEAARAEGRAIPPGTDEHAARVLAAEALGEPLPEAPAPPRFTTIDAHELALPVPPPRWVAEGLEIGPGAPALIAGYGFSGKSLAGQDLALAVASGTSALGWFRVRHGRAVFLDFDGQGRETTTERFQRLARARGVDLSTLPAEALRLVAAPRHYLDTPDGLAAMCDLASGADLLVVDSLRACAPRTDENSSEIRIVLDNLGRISEDTGAAFVVVHHARKPSGERGNGAPQGGAKVAIRGSAAIFDACASVFVFSAEKGEPVRVSHEKARRTGRPGEDFYLAAEDVAEGDDPRWGLALRYRTVEQVNPPKASDEDAAEARARAMIPRVLAAVARDAGATGNRLADDLGGNRKTVLRAIALALEEEQLRAVFGPNRARLLYLASAADGAFLGSDRPHA